MIDDYFSIYEEKIKEYGERTCVLYAVGSFYEIYQIDNPNEKIGNADKIADILHFMYSNKNKAKRQEEGSSRQYPDFCGFTISCLPKYLPILLDNDYTVVIVDQLESSDSKRGKLVKRGITAIHSPCLQPPELDSTGETNNLVGLYLEIVQGTGIKNVYEKSLLYSFCCINNSTNNIEIVEGGIHFYYDKIELCFEEINRILLKYNPKETIVKYKGESFNQKYLNLFLQSTQQYKLKIDEIDLQKFKIYQSPKFQNEYFKKIYKHVNFGMLHPIEYFNLEKLGISVINFMFTLEFIAKHDIKYVSNLNIPKIIEESDNLTLELNTLSQLNILPSRESGNHKYNSLFSVIDFTQTAIGKRRLKNLLSKPFRDPQVIQKKYDIIDELHVLNNRNGNGNSSSMFKTIDECLHNIFDFERAHRKMGLESLHPYEFEKLHSDYLNILKLTEICYNNRDVTPNLFDECIDTESFQNFHEYITDYKRTFDIDKMKGVNLSNSSSKELVINFFNKGQNEILDTISEKIESLRNEIEELRVYYDSKINDTENEYIKLSFTEGEGYHFICTKVRYQTLLKALTKKESDEFTLRQTSNTCKIFTSKLSKVSNDLINNKELLYKKIRVHYLSKLQEYYNKYYDVFNKLKEFVETIDIARSTIKCAEKYRYSRPEITLKHEYDTHSFLEASELRHPIIERMDTEYIPNDIILNKDNIGVLLYGLNSSGKSSLLRAVGISVILAQIGYYVPCKSFRYYPFKSLITQVDMTDNLFTGKSSFTSEMFSLKKILQCASKNTLVLADELCKTTEYFSAQGIVTSTITRLIEKDTPFFFTTHLHEIPKIKAIQDLKTLNICHLSVIVKDNNIIFERKLQNGSGSDLYGLEIAKNILEDSSFIDKAFDIRNLLSKKKGGIISSKKSVYNTKKIIDHCEVCNSNTQLETHHINFQKDCDASGFVNDKSFHKNELYNLVCLCKECHLRIEKDLIIYGYKKSTSGTFLDFEFT